MAARAATEAEMLEPWRKNFPICKPYAAHDKADAVRFLRELEEGCDGMDADIDYTLGEVIRGVHRGGNNAAAPPFFGNVNQQAKQTRDREKRRSKLSSTLKKYVLIEGVREAMRAASGLWDVAWGERENRWSTSTTRFCGVRSQRFQRFT